MTEEGEKAVRRAAAPSHGIVFLLSGLLGLAMAGCGGNGTPPEVDGGDGDGGHPGLDGGGRDGGPTGRCGDGTVDPGEECDDSNLLAGDGCSAECQLECGDGVVMGDELCDVGIADGEEGACPADCDDGDACTTDSLAGDACSAQCVHGAITVPAEGDGCCPADATAATDSDCPGTCGDGLVTGGEACDPGIATGEPGACPTVCESADPCVVADFQNAGTCDATCTLTDITAFVDGDGCCPAGGSMATDSDCAGECGNGVVEDGELCDTGIAAGSAGACPTSCTSSAMCTTSTLSNGGTCRARCVDAPITAPMDADGCCPAGATVCNDNDCAVRCGDSCVSPGEECDDGNTTSGDGCSSDCRTETVPATAFRFADLDLMDPHVYASTLLGCTDLTNFNSFGIKGINPLLQDNVQLDGDGDGELDLSIAHVFTPLAQVAGTSTPSYLTFPDCTAPMSSTTCTEPVGATRTTGTAVNQGGMGTVCLGIIAGTVRPYSPAVVQATSTSTTTCYSASAGSVTFDLGGIPITLEDAHIGGRWSGNPATQIVNGLIRGFLPEAQANFIYIPDGTTGQSSIDCQPLSRLLPGGDPPPFRAGDPQPPAPCAARPIGQDLPRNCASHSDLDTAADGTRGWYFYLNFRANRVPYTVE